MDTPVTITTEQEGPGFYIAQFKVMDLSIFSYYVESNKNAILIDPTIDVAIYEEFLNKRGATLNYVALTHYHADFLSGHTQFKVPILMGEKAKKAINSFQVTEHQDGKGFSLGSVYITVLHTPGHTPESCCFLLSDEGKKQVCIFTGDTIFLGDIGRPDLAAAGQVKVQDMAALLYGSMQKIKKLSPTLRMYPGHGAGSSCGKSIGAGNFCTLQVQLTHNYGLLADNQEQFITKLSKDIPPAPSYFFYDARINQEGPKMNFKDAIKQSAVALNVEEYAKLAESMPVIETRTIIDHGIIKGAYWMPAKGMLANWVSMILKPEEPFLIFSNKNDASPTIERLCRIGYFNCKGYNNFQANQWKGQVSRPVVLDGVEALKHQQRVHLDVRNKPEHTQLGVIENSILIPLGQVAGRVEELKGKDNIFVNCRTGLRARLAWSILARNGISSTVMADKFEQLEKKGHKVVKLQV